MHSYFEDEERTLASIKQHRNDSKKWMHIGDEGYLDSEGYRVVTGRIKDLIIRGGENIAPLEIEEQLFEHPAIKQACVFGIPDERYGEVVAAFLELEDGMERPKDEMIREWVRAYCRCSRLQRGSGGLEMWRGAALQSGRKTANGKLWKDIREIGAKLARDGASSELPSQREML